VQKSACPILQTLSMAKKTVPCRGKRFDILNHPLCHLNEVGYGTARAVDCSQHEEAFENADDRKTRRAEMAFFDKILLSHRF
jgi:hypothetical protein